MRKQMTTYRRQLYLYASAVEALFGQLPAVLQFNLFRENTMITETYNPEAHAEALSWMEDTIRKISQETRWPACPSSYFCQHVCSCSASCPVR